MVGIIDVCQLFLILVRPFYNRFALYIYIYISPFLCVLAANWSLLGSRQGRLAASFFFGYFGARR